MSRFVSTAGGRYPAAGVTAAAALLLAACGSSSSGADTAAAGPPRPGGTLTLGIAYNPDCLDPQQAMTNASLNVGRQLVDSLTDQDPKTGQIKPWLAQSWEVNPDATSYTFHLRDGATFSDGSPVNAQAVKDNFDSIVKLGAKSPLGSGYLGGYRGTTVLDEHTAKSDFAASSAQFLQASSTMSLGLLSPASLTKAPDQRCQGNGLIGSGPFVLDSVKLNQSVVISKRKGYNWGSSLWDHTGEAYLDKIDYRVTPEGGAGPEVSPPDNSMRLPTCSRPTRNSSPETASPSRSGPILAWCSTSTPTPPAPSCPRNQCGRRS